jgi:hypothetical protein
MHILLWQQPLPGDLPHWVSSLALFLYLDWSLDLTTLIILVLYCFDYLSVFWLF